MQTALNDADFVEAIPVSLFSMTLLGSTKKSRIIKVSSSQKYDRWRKVVVGLGENENISNMSLYIYTTSLSNIDGMK
jgi:hypothetical protein